MKTPVDTVKGRIVDYDERTGEVTIKAVYDDCFGLFNDTFLALRDAKIYEKMNKVSMKHFSK